MTGPSPFPSAVVLRSAGPNRPIDADWVLVGWRERGRCILLASEDVDHATLTFAKVRQQFEFEDVATMRAMGIKAARDLTATITKYVLIEADTFAECLAALLFGYQWKPETIRAIGTAGMGRPAGPHVQTEPTPPCGHRPTGTSVMYCEQPAGHYPDTPHAHTVTWEEDDAQEALPQGETAP